MTKQDLQPRLFGSRSELFLQVPGWRVMQKQHLPAASFGLVGVLLALIAYAAPFGNTGVDGSIGALLALIGAGTVALGAGLLVLGKLPHRPVWIAILVLAAVLTSVAAYFLMQFVLSGVMAAAALGLILAFFLNFSRGAP